VSGYKQVRQIVVSFVVCCLLLAVAIPAVAQSRLYEVQLDIFEDDEVVRSPSAIIEDGKEGIITVGDTTIALVVASEGMMEGKPIVSLTLDVTRIGGDNIKEVESGNIMSPTLFLPDTMQQRDPATISVGNADLAVSVRRLEPSEVTELMEAASEENECQSKGISTMGDGEASIDDDDCCSASCTNGSGDTLSCCGVIMCCDCGACCSP
jgi:hypothetical protein